MREKEDEPHPIVMGISTLRVRHEMPKPSVTFPDPSAKPEPLKGKSCVIISTQGTYQPLWHEFENPRDIPKMHLFYFQEFVQSPFDIPPVNVHRYLIEKRQQIERKKAKDAEDADVAIAYCEICKQRIKDVDEDHRHSVRHVRRLERLDWTDLGALQEELNAEIGIL
jgi:hypothetical protein